MSRRCAAPALSGRARRHEPVGLCYRDAAVARIAATTKGSRLDRLPVLAALLLTDEAGPSLLGGARISTFLTGWPNGQLDADPSGLPGEVWLRVVRTRPRADALFMAEHMILWVSGELGFDPKPFGDLARGRENVLDGTRRGR